MPGGCPQSLHVLNAFLTRKPLVNDRRLLDANNFLTSMPPNVFLTSVPRANVRKPLVTNAFLKYAPPRHNRRRLQQPSSFGFAAATSKSASPGGMNSGSNARLLSPACITSRNAAHVQQWQKKGDNRWWPRGQKRWPTKPTNNVVTRRPRKKSVGQQRRQATSP